MGEAAGAGSNRPPVVGLDDPEALDPTLVGAKAAALAAARRAGLPALPGTVLTTALSPADASLSRLAAWSAVSQGGTRSVVVRSSSTVEDGKHQSMAGLFTSVVDVRTLDGFQQAVDEVLASGNVVPLSGERSPLAVLVQPYVESAAGGVLFGVDPLTGRKDRLVLASVSEGPVALVQGETDGDTATLTLHGRLIGGTTALSPADRRRLARLARAAAARFGGPQDVEWAIDGEGHLRLLQSRPVTAVAGVARGPVLGPGPVAETFPDSLAPLEQDLWVEPLRSAIRSAVELVGAASRRAVHHSPVVTAVGGHVAVDLDLFGATTSTRKGLARLDPRPPARRLVAAWRVGRLRAALPALARDLLAKADGELQEVGDVAGLSDEALLAILAGAKPRLVALHGHEVLMGWLVSDSTVSVTTGASVALRLLAQGRAAGLSDDEVLLRYPTVLALAPPRVGELPPLPLTDGLPPAAAPDGAPDETAILREALRLRARWVQELSARAAWVLGQRLSARGVLDGAGLVRWLRLDELRTAVTTGALPSDLDERASAAQAAPLPARFRLTEGGDVVAVDVPPSSAGSGRGASSGRGVGRVHTLDESGGPPPEGSVLVVRSLEPRLASWLPRLAGLVAETGSPLSHLAILAREFRVPTAVGVADALERFTPGTTVLVDGTTGEVTPVTDAEQGAA